MKKQNIHNKNIHSELYHSRNTNKISSDKLKFADKEKRRAIYRWKIYEIKTRDELENEFEKINKKYGTNYKLTWYHEKYDGNTTENASTEYLN